MIFNGFGGIICLEISRNILKIPPYTFEIFPSAAKRQRIIAYLKSRKNIISVF